MAALGRTARTQIRLLQSILESSSVTGKCQHLRGFYSSPSHDFRSQIPVSNVESIKAWREHDVEFSAWSRPALSADILAGSTRAYATWDDEEMAVGKQVREDLDEPEGGPDPGLKDKVKQAAHRVGEKVKDAGDAIKGTTDNQGVEKVGDTVKDAGSTIKDKSSNPTHLGNEDVVTS